MKGVGSGYNQYGCQKCHIGIRAGELEEDLNDMCNLRQGIVEKAEVRGARGIVNIGIKYGAPKEDILAYLQESLNISLKKAQDYFAEYGKKTV